MRKDKIKLKGSQKAVAAYLKNLKEKPDPKPDPKPKDPKG